MTKRHFSNRVESLAEKEKRDSVSRPKRKLFKGKYKTFEQYLENCQCYKFEIITQYFSYVDALPAENYESAEEKIRARCRRAVLLSYGDLFTVKFISNEKITPYEAEYFSYRNYQKVRVRKYDEMHARSRLARALDKNTNNGYTQKF